jgi:hypothetical protein
MVELTVFRAGKINNNNNNKEKKLHDLIVGRNTFMSGSFC